MDAILAQCVAASRQHGSLAEIEMRLGSYADARFAAGVPKSIFDQLEQDLQDADLDADEGWTELVDYHYPTARGERVRTRVTFDTQHMELSTEHIIKQVMGSAVLCADGSEEEEACRVAWATETPLEEPPRACVPTHVRIKQRRCFRDVRGGRVVWSYELSKTWSASGRSAVEHLQRVSSPVYEVECELVDEGGAYLAARTDGEVAASLLLKARLLMGDVDVVLGAHDLRSDARAVARKRARK